MLENNGCGILMEKNSLILIENFVYLSKKVIQSINY